MVSRGDIWLVLPEAPAERTAAASAPCVVLSPPEIHDHLGIVTVAPIAPAVQPAGFHVPVALGERAGAIRLEQIRTVEKRLLTRQIGTLERKKLAAALAALREMFAD
jgi:mRNA interferase MazF